MMINPTAPECRYHHEMVAEVCGVKEPGGNRGVKVTPIRWRGLSRRRRGNPRTSPGGEHVSSPPHGSPRPYQPFFCASASYSRIDADTDTLSESADPSMGIPTRLQPASYHGLDTP